MEEEFSEPATMKTLTAKEMKNLAKPEFAANPELFYPTAVFEKYGYTRHQCPKCGANYWRHSETQTTCGDSNCSGRYSFIGTGTGKGTRGEKITYAEAWEGFKKVLTTTEIPSTAIDRYPVVARWRNDVEYVAAGIYCFQPYCVTGEMEAPANPLICPQFCVRFNDLDNIGLTGRHYSGFIMLGIQVFNLPGSYKFFKEECVDFNLRWLINELQIDPNDITLIEDVWAGGGNLGPSVEYFINGLELGNMVFMQYKTFPDGSREELPVKVIDVGIGLERIPWLVNGTPTSYMDVFRSAFEWLREILDIDVHVDIWEKFGPYSCLLNVDEIENIDQTWEHIASMCDVSVDTVRDAVAPIKDMYIVLDHTRTVLMVIEDGSLPSNVGGGSNVRNILRRVFSILESRGWWDKLGMDGLIELFQKHKLDLEPIYGAFKEYKSFREIIQVEYDRWITTDVKQKEKLQSLLKKSKGTLTLDDWIVATTSWGIPPETIEQLSKIKQPGDLYYQIDLRQQQIAVVPDAVLYDTTHLPETENLYYKDHRNYNFQAKIVDIFPNVKQENIPNIVILDASAFYPTSGGQQNDTGTIKIGENTYNIVNVEKAGHCVLHTLDQPISVDLKGSDVECTIDIQRRNQLRAHHTGTHIIFAACRKVLGPHVWQNGAKKTVENAHLDITHYKSLSHEQEQEIENEANRIIANCTGINKGFMDKTEAEKQYGFSLYQGGIVPGNNLRVVNIEGIDTEACCGTHCDNTSEVGWMRILKTQRVSDGIVRLYYVAGDRVIERLNSEDQILNYLQSSWGIGQNDIQMTADRFFNGYKKYEVKCKSQEQKILDLTMRCIALDESYQKVFIRSDQPNPKLYFSFLAKNAGILKETGKGVVFVSPNFIYGMLGAPGMLDQAMIGEFVAPKEGDTPKVNVKTKVSFKPQGKKTKPIVVDNIMEVVVTQQIKVAEFIERLETMGFTEVTN